MPLKKNHRLFTKILALNGPAPSLKPSAALIHITLNQLLSDFAFNGTLLCHITLLPITDKIIFSTQCPHYFDNHNVSGLIDPDTCCFCRTRGMTYINESEFFTAAMVYAETDLELKEKISYAQIAITSALQKNRTEDAADLKHAQELLAESESHQYGPESDPVQAQINQMLLMKLKARQFIQNTFTIEPDRIKLTGHDGYISGIRFLKQDMLVSISQDRTVRTWDLHAGKGITRYGHNQTISAIDVGNDFIITGDIGGQICIWPWQSSQPILLNARFDNPFPTAHAVSVLHYHDPYVIIGFNDGQSRIWRHDRRTDIWRFQNTLACDSAISSVAIQNNRVLMTSQWGQLVIYSLDSKQIEMTVSLSDQTLKSKFLDDTHLLSITRGTVFLSDLTTKSHCAIISDMGIITRFECNHNWLILGYATGQILTVQIHPDYSFTPIPLTSETPLHKKAITCLHLNAGKLYAGSDDGIFTAWILKSGRWQLKADGYQFGSSITALSVTHKTHADDQCADEQIAVGFFNGDILLL